MMSSPRISSARPSVPPKPLPRVPTSAKPREQEPSPEISSSSSPSAARAASPSTPQPRPAALSSTLLYSFQYPLNSNLFCLEAGAQRWDAISSQLSALQDDLVETHSSLLPPPAQGPASPRTENEKAAALSATPATLSNSFDLYVIRKEGEAFVPLNRSNTEAPSHQRTIPSPKPIQRSATTPVQALLCPACQLPVPGATSDSSLEKLYHPACFKCAPPPLSNLQCSLRF